MPRTGWVERLWYDHDGRNMCAISLAGSDGHAPNCLGTKMEFRAPRRGRRSLRRMRRSLSSSTALSYISWRQYLQLSGFGGSSSGIVTRLREEEEEEEERKSFYLLILLL